MKGYVAFCPHFHQPHFQLYKTREEAYQNSYMPWLNLLENAVKSKKFFINLHFSGPFLYWIQAEKPEFVARLKEILRSQRAGIIGGLIDESFIQLSSRRDDALYQLKMYDQLMQRVMGLSARDWQGIHIVERECGEILLHDLSKAAATMGIEPLFYLDAETFYQSHFNYPGSDSDYCLKHFGFVDPVSKTTVSHMPKEMLYFAMRDVIGGQEYYAFPVHSQFRYHLLKRQSFTAEDRVRTKPGHYYFYIKDNLEKACQMAKRWGKEIDPIVVIFEDAEKFGQWSKDPSGDSKWLMEFFRLIENDEELQFTGLKDYFLQEGYLDTYPASLSHSYVEWENWTARRGIRGVCYGDERLRKAVNRLRDVERMQEQIDQAVIADYEKKYIAGSLPCIGDIWQRAALCSPERFELVAEILRKDYPVEHLQNYEIVNRVRHMVYQEDPKWASRHPSYGSSPYYDVQGLAYLEIAERVLAGAGREVSSQNILSPVEIRDWDDDGQDEVVIRTKDQTAVIDMKGGCIAYHSVIASSVAGDLGGLRKLLKKDFAADVPVYKSIYKYSYPTVFTEADSSMAVNFYPQGGRREVCRNSFRCRLIYKDRENDIPVGNFDTAVYKLIAISETAEGIKTELVYEDRVCIGAAEIDVRVVKTFLISSQALSCSFAVSSSGESSEHEVLLVPQVVSSAAPSDEVSFCPEAKIGIAGKTEGLIQVKVEDILAHEGSGFKFKDVELNSGFISNIYYLYSLTGGSGDSFDNLISYEFSNCQAIVSLKVEPAVKHYYQGYVFDEQSRLGYHTSGIQILPQIAVENKETVFTVKMEWEMDTHFDISKCAHVTELINYND